jgi:autotransporter-associated beta strand protein
MAEPLKRQLEHQVLQVDITLGADSTLNVDGTQLTLSGVISDGANDYDIEKTGSGILVLSGTNTFSGTTTISGGTISIAADAGLGTAPGSAVAAQLTLNGGTLAATETFTLNANRGITLGSSHGTINVANTKTLTVAGIVAGSYNFTASGAGTLILTSASTYSGSQLQFHLEPHLKFQAQVL